MNNRKLRRHYRAKYFAEIHAHNYPKDSQDKKEAKPINLIVLNLSIDGIGVLSKEDVEIGSIVTFVLYVGGIGHEAMCYATFCSRIGEMYRVGLKLISPDNLFTTALKDYIESERTEI